MARLGSKLFEAHYSSTFDHTGKYIPPKTVKLQCSVSGCHQKQDIPWDRSMPPDTSKVLSRCPDHQSDGDFEEELYFDCKNKQLVI